MEVGFWLEGQLVFLFLLLYLPSVGRKTGQMDGGKTCATMSMFFLSNDKIISLVYRTGVERIGRSLVSFKNGKGREGLGGM
jgi:hypothetical protein